jgi:hypothetical protein
MSRIRVALLAGRRRSPASLLLLSALLRLSQIDVAAVLSVSELRWSRVRDWYLRFGLRALTKALREWGIGGEDRELAVLRRRMSEWTIRERSLAEVCRRNRIPFHIVNDVNGRRALDLVARARCDYGVYSGAGILRQPLLDSFPRGVLNLHCGALPAIRGMNGVEWHVFHGRPPEVTLHFIDAGIDTGRIVASRIVDVSPGDDVGSLRGKTILAGIDLLAELLPRIDRLPLRENPPAAGRQYFAMAETLKIVMEDRLSRHAARSEPVDRHHTLPRAA